MRCILATNIEHLMKTRMQCMRPSHSQWAWIKIYWPPLVREPLSCTICILMKFAIKIFTEMFNKSSFKKFMRNLSSGIDWGEISIFILCLMDIILVEHVSIQALYIKFDQICILFLEMNPNSCDNSRKHLRGPPRGFRRTLRNYCSLYRNSRIHCYRANSIWYCSPGAIFG